MPEVTPTPNPTPSALPAAPPTVLGVDPPAPAPAAPAPAPAAPAAPAPKTVTLTEEQHAQLLQNAQAFHAIEQDPQLSGIVGDHFRKLASGQQPSTPAAPAEPASEDGVSLNDFPEFKALQEGREQDRKVIQQLSAQIATQNLLTAHPDAKTYEREIVNLVNTKGYSLEDAYTVAKAQAGAATPAQPPPAPTPTAETHGQAHPPAGGEVSPLEAAEAKIYDPQKPIVRIEEAMDEAYAAATKQHNSQ